MYRKISYILFIFAFFILFAMGPHNSNTDEAIIIAQSEIYPYSIEELSKYNGKNNQPSYVAIDDVIYDVSDIEEWTDNLEENYSAGKDITEIIEESSIIEAIIEEAPEVGVLQEE